jgi:hypothetical protein
VPRRGLTPLLPIPLEPGRLGGALTTEGASGDGIVQ